MVCLAFLGRPPRFLCEGPNAPLGFHFEVPKDSKWSPGDPLETPWACFGGLGADVGAPGGLLEALGEHLGALGVASGPPGSAPGTVLGVIFGPFYCRTIWECLLRVLWKPASSSAFVVLGTLRLLQNGRDRSHLRIID